MPPSKPDSDSVLPREEFQPSLRALVSAGLAVAATYFYFLIFAQFGFLKTMHAVVGEDDARLRLLMAVMGGCGIAGSVLIAGIFSEPRGRALLLTGFGIGAGAAGLGMIAGTPLALFACAALTGMGTGMITVTLAALLRREVGGEKLGTCIGAGTGLAYGLCNLPPVFKAGATGQAAMGMAACAVGWLAAMNFAPRAPKGEAGGFDYRPGGIGGWVTVFFALVWLDTAAFYVIQHTPVLKGGTWGGGAQLYLNATVHVTAALLAGMLLDRRWMSGTVLVAAGLLLAALILIGAGPGMFSTGAFCYTAGVSCYSTALVYYVARSGRVGVAALVYAVAGWAGSALGIGMAAAWGAVPGWILMTACALIFGGFVGRSLVSRRGQRAGLVGVALLAWVWPEGDLSAQTNVETGRKVYIAEGCIHCHSQYVRPGTMDEILWGPVHPLAEALAQTPPLLGNRRQGPDLQNVALRRSRDWNRRHLIAPRTLTPGSRMPSYRRLFAGDAACGESLLDYLASLAPPMATGAAQ